MPQSALVVSGAAAGALIVVGLALQDWGGAPGPATGGRHDATEFTWITDYALGLECLLLALVSRRWSVQAAFVVEGLGWAAGGVLHQLFPQSSDLHDALWMASLALGVLAGFLKAGAVQEIVQANGRCGGCSSPLGVYGFLGLLAATGVGLAVYGQIPLQDWIFTGITKVLAMLIITILGCIDGACAESMAMVATFAAAIGVNQLKPEPFRWSTDFNDNALFHCLWMLYLVATMVLISKLASSDAAKRHEMQLRELYGRKFELEAMIHHAESTALEDPDEMAGFCLNCAKVC